MSGVLEDIRSNKYVYLFSFMGFLCVLFCFGLFVWFFWWFWIFKSLGLYLFLLRGQLTIIFSEGTKHTSFPFASVKHTTRIGVWCIESPCLWKWSLLLLQLLLVDYLRHRLSEFPPAIVMSPFDPRFSHWHLHLCLSGWRIWTLFYFLWTSWDKPDQ